EKSIHGLPAFAKGATLRFLSRRRVLAIFGVLLVALLVVGALSVGFIKAALDARARQYIVQQIEKNTGARVELGAFRWSILRQRVVLEDLSLHGLEAAEEAPLARVSRIEIGVNLRTLLQKRIDLFELTIFQPEAHIVVAPDGRTNFPAPKTTEQRPLDFKI